MTRWNQAKMAMKHRWDELKGWSIWKPFKSRWTSFTTWWGWSGFSYEPLERQQLFVCHRTTAYTTICALFLIGAMRFAGVEIIHIIFFGSLLVLFWIESWLFKLSFGLAEEKTRGDAATRNFTTGEVTQFGRIVSWFGLYGVIGLAFVFIFQVIRRVWFIQDDQAWYGDPLYYICVVLITLFLVFPMWRIKTLQEKKGQVPWLTIGFGMGFLVILFAWVSISLLWNRGALKNILEKHGSVAQNKPEACEQHKNIITNNNGGRIALTLSGGGYRAALIHAGLLAYLDEKHFSIDILSTVSGGSILGAAIATGVTPNEFGKALYGKKPGLPNDLMQIGSVIGDVILHRSLTQRYAASFERVFYPSITVGQLKDKPLLLVNVTDIEASPREARTVLYKGLDPVGDCDLVANLVAASGAYPGPFQPMKLRWPETTTKKPERQFADGGVVENLGVEGLLKYLSKPPEKRNWPKILIISDASGHGNPKRFRSKPDLITVLTGALDISLAVSSSKCNG